jgi:RNA recognition motif-containing protein
MSNNKLFVHGFRASVPLDERKQMIIDLFSQYGNIKIDDRTGEEAIAFIKDKDKGDNYYKNFCFVTMEDAESAQAVVDNCNGYEFPKGIILSVSVAEERKVA